MNERQNETKKSTTHNIHSTNILWGQLCLWVLYAIILFCSRESNKRITFRNQLNIFVVSICVYFLSLEFYFWTSWLQTIKIIHLKNVKFHLTFYGIPNHYQSHFKIRQHRNVAFNFHFFLYLKTYTNSHRFSLTQQILIKFL